MFVTQDCYIRIVYYDNIYIKYGVFTAQFSIILDLLKNTDLCG